MLQERIDPVVKGYELREQIGAGGYGVVHRAYQPLIGRDVAVKIILPQYANHPDFIRRFEWEAQLVARLEHPYIVPLYDYWRDPDGAFLVMRWLRGGNLHDLLHNRPLPTELLSRLIEQIGGALALAHRRGVVHRDLKPANILLDEEGNAYLADFGIAKDMGTRGSPYQTDATTVVGSPAYISPEQVRAEPITPQTDIYSLGVMLYEILTGQLPFQAPTPIALMFMHMNEPVPTVRTQRPDLSDAVNMVIQKATAKRPIDRYADVTTLLQELRQALASGPAVTARLTDTLPTPSQPEHGNRTTSGTTTRSKYETGVLYLPVPLAAPIEAPIENPYKGLRAFQEADADDFFGRELLTQLLLTRMQEQAPLGRFLAVVGPSGSGKSSVVRAGLVPAIRRGGLPGSENWFVAEMFPSAHPIEELAQALIRIAVEPPNNLVEPLRLDEQGLLRVVDQVVPGADETEVVLVIDQFEEVFTLVEDETERTHFLNSLINAVTDPYSRIRVIVTLRADFYDRPLLYPGFSELMRQRTEVVVPLTQEELKQAIVSPAERNGLRVDAELVEAIISDVAEQPGALPLLQYALTEVFERRSSRTLTLTPYNASGGVLGALARRAEEIYTGLRAEQQEAARQLFLRLVTLGEGVEDTRRRVRLTELAFINHREHTAHGAKSTGSAPAIAAKAALDEVINIYSQYRLLTRDNDPATRMPTVEVAHEALIRTWTRLRQWLDASRDDLRLQRRMTTAAAEWVASGHDRSFLASGTRLEQLAGWADETHLALNAEERDYLGASLAERDAQQAQEAIRKAHEATLERRSRTFLQALVGVALVAAVLGIGLSVYAFGQRQAAVQKEQLALQSADVAATAEARANTAAEDAGAQRVIAEQRAADAARAEAQAQSLALTQGAQAALSQGNLDQARELALVAASRPNPLPLAEQTLADAAYRPGTRMLLRGHEGNVNGIAYSPDETMAISAGREDMVLILWDLTTGKEIRRFEGHTGRVRQVVFLPDGKQVLSASEDKTLILWDVATAKPIRTFKKHDGEVKGVALRPNSTQFMSASADTSLMLWDVNCTTPTPDVCEQPIRIFAPGNGGHTQEVNEVTFTSDGKYALSSSEDTTLILWDVETGAPVKHFVAENGREVRGVAILKGDRLALSGGADSQLTLWDLTTEQAIRHFKGHTGTVYALAVNPDGTRALSGASDNTMMLWDLTDPTPIQRPIEIFRGHGAYIRQIRFSKDGHHVLSAGTDKVIRVWDLENGAQQWRRDDPTALKNGIFSPDGRYILTATGAGSAKNGDAKLYDAATGEFVKEFPWHERDVNGIAFSPDGKFILTAGDKGDGTLILSNVATGAIERTFKKKVFGVNTVAFTPDGKRVVSGLILPGETDYVKYKALDPALKTIGMMVWDVETGEPINTFPDLQESVSALTLSQDGTQIFAGAGSGGDITVWDLASGKQLRVFEGHSAKINSMAITPDGKLLISGGADRVFIVWDVASGKPIYTSVPQSAAITAVAISHDGRYAAETVEGGVAVWDLQSKQILRNFLGHQGNVSALQFSADSRTLLSVGGDRTARLWRLETLPELIAWAQANRYFPNLTCDQEQLYNLPTTDCK